EVNYLGKTWSAQFKEIFGEKSRYVVCILDKHHSDKIWPTFEREIFMPRVVSGTVIPARCPRHHRRSPSRSAATLQRVAIPRCSPRATVLEPLLRIRLVNNPPATLGTRRPAVGVCLPRVVRGTACLGNRLLIRPQRGALPNPKARRRRSRLLGGYRGPRGRGS